MRLFVDLWSNPNLVDLADENFMYKVEQDLLLHLSLEHPIYESGSGLFVKGSETLIKTWTTRKFGGIQVTSSCTFRIACNTLFVILLPS